MSQNFDKWFDDGGLWANDPYISESTDIEKCCARVGWDVCRENILNILDKYSNSSDIKYIIEEIKSL